MKPAGESTSPSGPLVRATAPVVLCVQLLSEEAVVAGGRDEEDLAAPRLADEAGNFLAAWARASRNGGTHAGA